ncbi:hypothetical protein AB6A40_002979 [Gnathostoma spinigerum]|uniref:Uncharacterized protein n=1 Tax=Gnathostoma spinigerum TaxID=75299 RepID=A0ABD6E9C5_9BILA
MTTTKATTTTVTASLVSTAYDTSRIRLLKLVQKSIHDYIIFERFPCSAISPNAELNFAQSACQSKKRCSGVVWHVDRADNGCCQLSVIGTVFDHQLIRYLLLISCLLLRM